MSLAKNHPKPPSAIIEISRDHPVILFDGYCMLCNGFIQRVLKKDKKGIFRYSTLSNNRQGSPASVLLVYHTKVYDRSTAALLISKYLGFPYNILSGFLLVPRFIRDKIYNWIAINRYRWFGQSDTCYVPQEQNKHLFLT